MLHTLKFIISHPLNANHKVSSLRKFVQWQIKSRLFKGPFVHTFTENSHLFVSRGETGATGNIYGGLHEFYDMAFLLHLLRCGDLFVDIGANIGSYTVLSSAEIGANNIAIEPVPMTFERLIANLDLNKINHNVQALNIALGKEKGMIRFTQSYDTINHVATEQEINTIDVPVDTLDNILQNKNPILLKVDVEGFETEVLHGAHHSLQNESLKAIIIELNGSGRRYGYDDQHIHIKLIDHGFKPFDYDPFNRQLTEKTSFGHANTLYLRDLANVASRVKSARKIKVANQLF